MAKILKLYVWEGKGVLTDYADGMICVLAYSLSEALKLIAKKDKWAVGDFPIDKYKLIKKPEAFICQGGS